MKTTNTYYIGPETERLLHRAFTVADAEAAFELNSDPDVLRYTGDNPLCSVEDARRFIADYPDFREFGFGRWACIHKPTKAIIGFCGLKYLPEFNEIDIGYRFIPSYWGIGLATEACIACLEFGFHTMGLNRIVAFVMPENVASIRVVEKSGMLFDAEFDYDGTLTLRFAACG